METTPGPEKIEIDLDKEAWEAIKAAARRSQWIPEDYFMNDWVSDVCHFLRMGPGPARSGFDNAAWTTVVLRPSLRWRLGLLRPGAQIQICFGQDLYYIPDFKGEKLSLMGVQPNVEEQVVQLCNLRDEMRKQQEERAARPDGGFDEEFHF